MYQIGMSIGNFSKASFFMPLEIMVNKAKTLGYDGIQYIPIRFFASLQVKTGLVSKDALRGILCAEQSYRSEKSISQVLKHRNKKLAAMAYIGMEEKLSSLETLHKLQRLKTSWLPLVVYPPDTWEINHPKYNELKSVHFQPTPEHVSEWNLKNPDELLMKANDFGIYSFCLDTYHLRRTPIRGNQYLWNWRELLPKLLPDTTVIHIGAGRNDFSGIDSMGELYDLIFRTEITEIWPILRLIKRNWDNNIAWSKIIVTEIPANSITKVANLNFNTVHSRITENLRNLFN